MTKYVSVKQYWTKQHWKLLWILKWIEKLENNTITDREVRKLSLNSYFAILDAGNEI